MANIETKAAVGTYVNVFTNKLELNVDVVVLFIESMDDEEIRKHEGTIEEIIKNSINSHYEPVQRLRDKEKQIQLAIEDELVEREIEYAGVFVKCTR